MLPAIVDLLGHSNTKRTYLDYRIHYREQLLKHPECASELKFKLKNAEKVLEKMILQSVKQMSHIEVLFAN